MVVQVGERESEVPVGRRRHPQHLAFVGPEEEGLHRRQVTLHFEDDASYLLPVLARSATARNDQNQHQDHRPGACHGVLRSSRSRASHCCS